MCLFVCTTFPPPSLPLPLLFKADAVTQVPADECRYSETGAPPPPASSTPQALFVKPHLARMPFKEFYENILSDSASPGSPVSYLSQQDDNLRKEFGPLCEDIPVEGLPIARDAFGQSPDAGTCVSYCVRVCWAAPSHLPSLLLSESLDRKR